MRITPYSKNAKQHTDSQLKALANVVKEMGWRLADNKLNESEWGMKLAMMLL